MEPGVHVTNPSNGSASTETNGYTYNNAGLTYNNAGVYYNDSISVRPESLTVSIDVKK